MTSAELLEMKNKQRDKINISNSSVNEWIIMCCMVSRNLIIFRLELGIVRRTSENGFMLIFSTNFNFRNKTLK